MERVGVRRPPKCPITPATSTISGNGNVNAKMATNAAAAIAHSHALCRVRLPMRQAAKTTIAVMTGLMPGKMPAMAGTVPKAM